MKNHYHQSTFRINSSTVLKKFFQRARRPRRVRRVPHKVDKSLQCNIQQTNQLPSDLPNQVGFCKLCFFIVKLFILEFKFKVLIRDLIIKSKFLWYGIFFIKADPDTDSGYCSPQQRAQKSSTESGLAKATSPQSPTPPGAPPNLGPSGVPQNSSPKPPSYSQVVKDSSASTPQQPPNPLSCGSGKTTFFNTFHSKIIIYEWYMLHVRNLPRHYQLSLI